MPDPSNDPRAAGRVRLGNPANSGGPPPTGACRVVMIGDVIGKPGRLAVESLLPSLREERSIDFVTANGENLAGGMGLTQSVADSLLATGVDVITSGNHIWDKREIYPSLEIVLQRVQAREEPVAQDPSAIESEEDDEDDDGRVKAPGLPGSANARAD